MKLEKVIYKTTNNINGKIYIGQSSKNNPRYLGSGINIRNDLKIYGVSNFTKEILEYCNTKEELNNRERYWIAFYNSTCPEIGYNKHRGGQGRDTLGRRLMNDGQKHYYIHIDDIDQMLLMGYVFGPLESTIEKCRKASSGVNNPNYGNRGVSNILYGRKHSSETRKKMSENNHNRGKKLPDSVIQKLSAAKLGENNPMYGVKQKTTKCQNCGKIIPVNIHNRFHGLKCKSMRTQKN